jgi:hypothetical protein
MRCFWTEHEAAAFNTFVVLSEQQIAFFCLRASGKGKKKKGGQQERFVD